MHQDKHYLEETVADKVLGQIFVIRAIKSRRRDSLQLDVLSHPLGELVIELRIFLVFQVNFAACIIIVLISSHK
jgi:hypothetical protein